MQDDLGGNISVARSKNMAAIRSTNTTPELVVRKLIHGLGYRYRVHATELPGKPDIVNRSKRHAIFIHGCFWHSHAKPGCPRRNVPKTNSQYWGPKLQRNVERDQRNMVELVERGYSVLTIWECEIKNVEWLRETLRCFCCEQIACKKENQERS